MSTTPSKKTASFADTFLYIFALIVSLNLLMFVESQAKHASSYIELFKLTTNFLSQSLIGIMIFAGVSSLLIRSKFGFSALLIACILGFLAVITFGGGSENTAIFLTMPLAIFLAIVWILGHAFKASYRLRVMRRSTRIIIIAPIAIVWLFILTKASAGVRLDVEACTNGLREIEQGRCLLFLAKKEGDFSICGEIPPSYGGSQLGYGIRDCILFFSQEKPELLQEQPESVCDNFKPHEAKGLCYTALGIAQKDFSICQKMPVKYTANCYAAMAVEKDDFDLCLQIPLKDVWTRDGCIEDIAIARKNSSLCEHIKRSAYSARCKDRVQ